MSSALLDEYLATLPRGAESHPECSAKGSLVRAYLEARPVRLGPSYPLVLRRVVEGPVLAASWIPEVAFLSVALLVREQHFTDDDAFLQWVRELNSELFRAPLYRVLMLVATTRMMLSGASRRWKQFHLGTELTGEHGDRSSELDFRFPLRLFSELHVRLFGEACCAAIEAAGGRGCRIADYSVRTHVARVSLRWD